jgi:hypothetical protein
MQPALPLAGTNAFIWRKARNDFWGIAFWGKLGYFIENETLARLYATVSAHRHSMNEEVPW